MRPGATNPRMTAYAARATITEVFRSGTFHRIAQRMAPSGDGASVTVRNDPGNHVQPPQQHRTRRQDATNDHLS